MVSGFLTSPCDHWRIFSGDASEMRMALKESGSLGFSKKLKISFTVSSFSVSLGYRQILLGDTISWCPRHFSRRRSSGLLGLSRRHGGSVLHQLDIQTERLELLDQDVERLRQPRLERVLALDDALVHPGAAHHVVRLHGEELLQRVRRAVGFHRPDFHLSQALATKLRLPAQGLLGDERVRPAAARVALLGHQVG